ncbi:MAG: insulinase family protein [Planctomycetia bacterium]|nr:insulinase family protein [Planctomycetia bacterium]
MQFRKQVLDNGLEIVAEVNDEARSSSLGFFVRTGARDETDDVAGVSHFLEHMMFKGTPTRTAEQVNLEFDALGADYNAFTSEEQTVYYASVLPEYQGRTTELLADMLRPSLRTEDFDTEKKVIVEEIRMYLDQPPFGADDLVRSLHYGKHPLGRSVLGTVESIEALPVDAMRAYFERRYSPTNIMVAAAGKIDFDKLVEDVHRYCHAWQRIETERDITTAVGERKFQVLHKPKSTQEYVIQVADAPSSTDADRYAAKILTVILGDDSGSRFFWEIVDPGLAESASLSHHDGQGSGAFIGYLACDPELAADNLQRLAKIYADVEAGGVTETELAQAKSKLNSRVVLSGERPRGRLFNIGGNWMQRREYRTIHDDLEAVDRITTADLAAVVKKWPLTKNTTVVVGPLETI